MGTVLTRGALGLFAACLLASPAVADPSSRSRDASVTMPASAITRDTARPQPILWDRLERSAIERPAKTRKPVLPPSVPAESAERPNER